MGLFVGVAPANADGPVRILLTGDSLTQGFNGDYTWRYRLAKEFARQGKAVDFVGSRKDPYVKAGWTSSRYADPNFDSNHFARTGSTMASLAGWISDEVAEQQPDVVVLMAGVNDFRAEATPGQVDTHLRRWVREAREAKPDVRLIISSVLDARDSRVPDLAQRIAGFNQMLPDTIADLTTDQSPVSQAMTANGWSLSLTTDNLHATPTGESFIAQRVAEALKAAGILTQNPPQYQWTSWNRQPRVGVVVRNQRAVLTWDYQAIDSARVWLRRVGYAANFSAARYARGTMTTTPLVARATYEFRVSFLRGQIATPLGPITRVTAPGAQRPAAVSRVVVNARGVAWTRSALATKYVVKFRKIHRKRWITRQTTRLYVASARVKQARVWAVNSAGSSAMRAGAR